MMPFLKAQWDKKAKSILLRPSEEIFYKQKELYNKLLEAERMNTAERINELKLKLEVLNWVIKNG